MANQHQHVSCYFQSLTQVLPLLAFVEISVTKHQAPLIFESRAIGHTAVRKSDRLKMLYHDESCSGSIEGLGTYSEEREEGNQTYVGNSLQPSNNKKEMLLPQVQ